MFDTICKGIITVLSTVLIILIPYSYYLNSKNLQLQRELDAYNLTIEIMAKDIQDRANELPKIVKEVKYRTQEKIKVVKEYVYDNNKTEEGNAIAILRSTGF